MKVLIKCQCGNEISVTEKQAKRKKYCSKRCFYIYRKRPSGLKYKIVSNNKGWFVKGTAPYNKGTAQPVLDKSIGYMKLRGEKYHRYLMEKLLGRKLRKEEVVHHIDGNKLNNDIDNLELFESKSEHLRFHWATDRRTR